MQKRETFGELIRRLREQAGYPLRKVAAELDIDPSTLSKIERSDRLANKQMIERLARLFRVDYDHLLISLLSDKVAIELVEEELSDQVLKVAEEKVKYFKAKKLTQGKLKLD